MKKTNKFKAMEKLDNINKVIAKLERQASNFMGKVAPTTTNISQFKENIKCEYLGRKVNSLKTTIIEHQAFLGCEVFKFEHGFRYSDVNLCEQRQNKTVSTSVLFTEEHLFEFVQLYLEYQVTYYTDKLVKSPITSFSSCPISNYQFQIHLSCYQEIIELADEWLFILNPND